MPVVAVIVGLVVLFLAAKAHGGSATGGGVTSPQVPNDPQMPDPGANHASMVGSISAHVPPNTSISPFPGTSKISPDTSLIRLNGSNRVALRGLGTPQVATRVPLPRLVRTTNPAVVPVSATATRVYTGTVATTIIGNQGGTKL